MALALKFKNLQNENSENPTRTFIAIG